jgi:hypothetical protein
VRYTSNLTAPDLRRFFKLANPMIQKMGHDIPSDPDFDPNCGFLSDDEAAILYAVARAWPKRWVDIGARVGWTTCALIDGGALVKPVDPELKLSNFSARFEQNTMRHWEGVSEVWALTSEEFFAQDHGGGCDAAMIDGNHDEPEPTHDALRAIDAGASVLVFHDFAGKPIRDAVNALLHGQRYPGDVRDGIVNLWRARVYWTPNAMAVAWRDGCGFVPPEHVRDPRADWSGMERIVAEDFDVRRCV